jgi:hypothetical protein
MAVPFSFGATVMPHWAKAEFLEQASRLGGSKLVEAHSRFLDALHAAGASPTFDGTGEKRATYTVRAVPGAHWHILRVWANGHVILMLNHLREHVSERVAVEAARLFGAHVRSSAPNCPYLSHDLDEFRGLDFDAVARAAHRVITLAASLT